MIMTKFNRILAILVAIGIAFLTGSGVSFAQSTPSADGIFQKLNSSPKRPLKKSTIGKIKRDRSLRRQLPSIDIQTINFAFGSAVIPRSQRWKVGNIAKAIKRFRRRGRVEVFLLEGHTDAVGSESYNLALSRQRARSLKRDLVRYFGVRPHVLETEGYGEYDLLVPTQEPNWRNRRVTIRRISPVLYN